MKSIILLLFFLTQFAVAQQTDSAKRTIVEDETLTFDMYETKMRSLVWSGGVNKTFSPKDDVEKIIGDYTKKIFKKLPIRVK